MKALTAFRNVIRRRAEIEETNVKCLLCTDNEIHFIVKYKVKPKAGKKMELYDIFVAARKAAQRLL